jgi:hypothetical protein
VHLLYNILCGLKSLGLILLQFRVLLTLIQAAVTQQHLLAILLLDITIGAVHTLVGRDLAHTIATSLLQDLPVEFLSWMGIIT